MNWVGGSISFSDFSITNFFIGKIKSRITILGIMRNSRPRLISQARQAKPSSSRENLLHVRGAQIKRSDIGFLSALVS